MGEYGRRKSDGAKIKIGCCQENFYVRLEDKNKITPDKNSRFGCYWRVPLPFEDHYLPGDYPNHQAGANLPDFTANGIGQGIIQLKHPSGLLINAPCFHGAQLPENVGGYQAFWNGKSGVFVELSYLKTKRDAVAPIARCRFCGTMWEETWENIFQCLRSTGQTELLERLEIYAKEAVK